jgi:predicted glycosyltransferase
MVKCPPALKLLESILHRIILWFVKKYDECWIPDVEGTENLSGDLAHSHHLPANAKFIGWLSRFHSGQNISSQNKYELLALLSGTEPQRTILEKILTEQIKNTTYKTLLVRGVTEEQKQFVHQNNLTIVPYLNSAELFSAMYDSEIIICRSGYSTLMDLAATGKKAILIPTPGQTEQEYLGKILSEKNTFSLRDQNHFVLDECIKLLQHTSGIKKERFRCHLEMAIQNLI